MKKAAADRIRASGEEMPQIPIMHPAKLKDKAADFEDDAKLVRLLRAMCIACHSSPGITVRRHICVAYVALWAFPRNTLSGSDYYASAEHVPHVCIAPLCPSLKAMHVQLQKQSAHM